MSYKDIDEMSDAELERRIMGLLKRNCDKSGMPYPPKLVAYLARPQSAGHQS